MYWALKGSMVVVKYWKTAKVSCGEIAIFLLPSPNIWWNVVPGKILKKKKKSLIIPRDRHINISDIN